MLTPEEVKEFQGIIEDEYGVKLSEAEATVMAKRLLLLYELVYRKTLSERMAAEQSGPPVVDDPPLRAS